MRFGRTVAGHSVVVCVALTSQREVEHGLAARRDGLHLIKAALLGRQPAGQHDRRRIVRGTPILGRASLVVPVVRVVAKRELSTRNL